MGNFENRMDEYGEYLYTDPWYVDKSGVRQEKEIRKYNKVVAVETEFASCLPLLPVSIIENMDSKTEKLEISFYKHNKWHSVITPRSVVANRNSIIKLADSGIEVNSDNAAQLVRYIADVVAKSLDTMPHRQAKSVLGWVGDEFVPYSDEIAFDGEDTFRYLYGSVTQKGDLQEWVDFVRPLREKLELRLCMAASFASPLIERVGENPFVFHLWGTTGAGKTVSLMVAMSIWGNPLMGRLTRTMNMTKNSMMATAAFLRNLPFAGDELQTIKSRWDNYDALIMCITEGIDRGRMSYDKVNETKSWKCSFLFSGEEPCIKQASGGGAKNRVIEVESKGDLIKNGNTVVNFLRSHYGNAGVGFVSLLPDLNITNDYSAKFREIMDNVDTTDKQAGSMALMLVADEYARRFFWPEEKPLSVDDVRAYLYSSKEVDIAERAYQFICGAVAENVNNFSPSASRVWGKLFPDQNAVFFNRNVLSSVLNDAGFDFDAVKQKWVDKGYIEKPKSGYGIRQTCRICGVMTSGIRISLPAGREEEEESPAWA